MPKEQSWEQRLICMSYSLREVGKKEALPNECFLS